MIPILNLIKVPGLIQEGLGHDRRGIGADPAATTVDEVAAVFNSIIDQAHALAIITEVMIAGGSVVLVLLMGRIEARCAARDREIRAAVLG